MRKRLLNFWIDKETLQKFKAKYKNISARIRELIESDLNNNSEIIVQRDNLALFRNLIFEDELPIQVYGNVGVGKSSIVKKLIENTSDKVFVVLDSHNEYDLPTIQTIPDNLKKSVRILLPEQPSAAQGIFNLYANQILSRKWPDNYCFVIEESHRYKETKLLLREGRKFAKLITISPDPLVSFCKCIRIVK